MSTDSKDLKPGIIFKLLQIFFGILAFSAPFLIGLEFYVGLFLAPHRNPDPFVIINMVIGFVLSVGMLKRKRWAWILNIVEGVIGMGFGLINYIKQPSDTTFMPILFGFVLTALIYSQRRFYTRS